MAGGATPESLFAVRTGRRRVTSLWLRLSFTGSFTLIVNGGLFIKGENEKDISSIEEKT